MRYCPLPSTTVDPAGFLALGFRSIRTMRPSSIITLPLPMWLRFSGETIVTSVIQMRSGCGFGPAATTDTVQTNKVNSGASVFTLSSGAIKPASSTTEEEEEMFPCNDLRWWRAIRKLTTADNRRSRKLPHYFRLFGVDERYGNLSTTNPRAPYRTFRIFRELLFR